MVIEAEARAMLLNKRFVANHMRQHWYMCYSCLLFGDELISKFTSVLGQWNFWKIVAWCWEYKVAVCNVIFTRCGVVIDHHIIHFLINDNY